MVKTVFKLSVLSASLLAATAGLAAGPSNAELQKEIRTLMKQHRQLQNEVHMLKAQNYPGKKYTYRHNIVRRNSPSTVLQTADRSRTVLTDRFDHPLTVTTSPLIGPSTGGAGNILEQMSKDNQQLTLTQQRAALMRVLHKEGDSDLYRPIIELSGGLEGQLYGINGYRKGTTPRGVSLATAELDVNGIVGPWASGFMALDYDNSPASSGSRAPVGTVYLDRGIVMLGNLNRFPVYIATGEMYVPFGRYGSLMLTSPMNESLARTKSDTALVGYSHDGIYGELFGYNGAQTSGHNRVFKQAGLDAGYTHKFGPNGTNSYRVGASMESNLADSQGLQVTRNNTALTNFPGFSTTSNNLQHKVPAYALYANVIYKRWTFIAQYVNVFRAFGGGVNGTFNGADMTYGDVNGLLKGARPAALHTEINYTFHRWNKPFTLGADYDQTWQALAADLPRRSFTVDAQTSWFRNTTETIEYRHDVDYGQTKKASGGGNSAFTGSGQSGDTVVAQLGVYF